MSADGARMTLDYAGDRLLPLVTTMQPRHAADNLRPAKGVL